MTEGDVRVTTPVRDTGKRKLNSHFRSEARRTLFAGDNYYRSVLSHLICGLFSGGALYLSFYAPDLIKTVFGGSLGEESTALLSASVNTVLYLVSAFLFFAFFSGVYLLASAMKDEPDTAEGDPDPADLSMMLRPVGSHRSLSRTAGVFIILAAELALAVIPAVYVISRVSGTGIDPRAAAAVKIVSVIAASLLSLFFIILLVPMPYALEAEPDAGVLELYRKSAKAAVRGAFRCVLMLLSFIPHLILSVLSFGVMFFAYTLPYMTLSMAKLGEYLYNITYFERKKTDEQA